MREILPMWIYCLNERDPLTPARAFGNPAGIFHGLQRIIYRVHPLEAIRIARGPDSVVTKLWVLPLECLVDTTRRYGRMRSMGGHVLCELVSCPTDSSRPILVARVILVV